ncbi:MAG: hypothetical protein C0518_05675 [Opitutus sp.]|nr:hypothetical protein [Opitutus sp.]
MKLQRWRGVILACVAVTLHAAEVTYVADAAQALPPETSRALGMKLERYERSSGVRVLLRVLAKSPTVAEDEIPGAYMKALATKLGTAERGALLVYFADDPDWRLWIGDELAGRFAGKSGTVAEPTANSAIHDVKEAMFTAAKEKGAKGPTPTERLTLETEALLAALMARLKP